MSFSNVSPFINLWGNLDWQVKINCTEDLDDFLLEFVYSSSEEITEYKAKNLKEIANIIKKFAEEKEITFFDRRVASFLYSILMKANIKISEEEILEKIKTVKKVQIVEAQIDSSYEYGHNVPFAGLLRLKIKIGKKGALTDPFKLIYFDTATHTTESIDSENIYQLVGELKTKLESYQVHILDRRLARWLSDYCEIELRLQLSFNEALDIVQGKKTLNIDESYKVEETPRISQEDTLNLIPINDEVQHRIKSINLALDDNNRLLETLNHLLNSNKDEENINVERNIGFTINGEQKSIEPIKLESKAGNKPIKRELTSSFNNTFDSVLSNVTLTDIIPYDLKIDDIEISDEVESIKELVEAGLKLTYTINELQPESSIDIKYVFSRRINRSILLQKGNLVDVINTNFPVTQFKEPLLNQYEGKVEFISIIQTYDNILISDFIPDEFNITDTVVNLPLNKDSVDIENGIELKWNKENIREGEIIEHDYFLEPKPYLTMYRSFKDYDAPFNFTVLYQPLIGSKNSILTVITEYESMDHNNYSLQITIPIDANIIQFIGPEKGKAEYLWEINPSPTATDSILSINMWFSKPDQKILSFGIQGEVNLLDYLQPIVTVKNEVESTFNIPEFTNRVPQYIPLPKSHLELYKLNI